MLYAGDLHFPKRNTATKEYVLPDDLTLIRENGNRVIINKGETIKLKQTTNFGWVSYNGMIFKY